MSKNLYNCSQSSKKNAPSGVSISTPSAMPASPRWSSKCFFKVLGSLKLGEGVSLVFSASIRMYLKVIYFNSFPKNSSNL